MPGPLDPPPDLLFALLFASMDVGRCAIVRELFLRHVEARGASTADACEALFASAADLGHDADHFYVASRLAIAAGRQQDMGPPC